MRRQRWMVVGMVLFATTVLSVLGAAQNSAQPSTLVVNVREVTVDVAVYDGNGYLSRGNPISGLRKEDFEVLEDGKIQTIRSFEEHTSHAQSSGTDLNLASKSGGPYSIETSREAALTVILLDLASTDFEAQPWMLKEVRTSLDAAPAANPIAIFALTPGLRVLHGFSTDKTQLLEALRDKLHGISPTRSPFLESADEVDMDSRPAELAREAESEHPTASGSQMSAQLERFQTSLLQAQAMQRTSNTLNAFQQIGHYLAVFPVEKTLSGWEARLRIARSGSTRNPIRSSGRRPTCYRLHVSRCIRSTARDWSREIRALPRLQHSGYTTPCRQPPYKTATLWKLP